MIFRILALNTVFLMLFIVRRARGSRPLRESKLIGVQALLIGANFLVMFQRDLQWVFDRFS